MRPLARAQSLLLSLLFLGMGTVAPVVDAAVFHRASSGPGAHIESRDNPACHAERCAMPLVQATSAGAPAAATALTSVLPEIGQRHLLPVATTPRTQHPGARRSRAPPSLLA